LLLHLVKDLEIDIYDIPVAELTDQYMEYVNAMQEIELNIASEYLVMAATLLEIKSSMLLPKQEMAQTDGYEEDPREELIERLIEYKKFKEAAESLKEKESEEQQLFTRPPLLFKELEQQPIQEVGDIPLEEMVQALADVFQRQRWKE